MKHIAAIFMITLMLPAFAIAGPIIAITRYL
jgi:hypothetical protein